jgi:hypothetical protein
MDTSLLNVDVALPPAPPTFLAEPSSDSLVLELVSVGPYNGVLDLSSLPGIAAVTALWTDVRLERISFFSSMLAEETVLMAALVRANVSSAAPTSIACAPVRIVMRRTDLVAGSLTAELRVVQGMDSQLVGPRTIGSSVRLALNFNGQTNEFVTLRMHCRVGGPARAVVMLSA